MSANSQSTVFIVFAPQGSEDAQVNLALLKKKLLALKLKGRRSQVTHVVTCDGGIETAEQIAASLQPQPEIAADEAWSNRMRLFKDDEAYAAASELDPGWLNISCGLTPAQLQAQIRQHEDDILRLAFRLKGKLACLVSSGPLTAAAIYGMGLAKRDSPPLSFPKKYMPDKHTLAALLVDFHMGENKQLQPVMTFEQHFVQQPRSDRIIFVRQSNGSSS
ncbi:MAG: hypothetical protein COU35_05270 [Candidatus Magasanikbacteria bacterium CG10_big_fil_rev_8_21_14_0_10_47_10]|uniref:Uncharacterized protein n=1 Tax=Candidatus Magasanikbacteria bacterium CG10_big_fil_rev_8_21_14_0_10_47_10 TaxID=1974652 RepID=A0A2H0TP26_9BACT|nr:MAG: hypothetical protein COU35_05270 [Candidatus Magasanikbacteria bacterium CG10_big_fil_rev_8_21_14_0_10_47_10]